MNYFGYSRNKAKDKTKDKREDKNYISVSARYSSICSEINARIGARQSCYLGHAVACAGVLTSLGKVEGVTEYWLLAPSIIGVAFGCWIRFYDLTVGLLAAFCRICEEQVEDDLLPSYPSSTQGWQTASMHQREWIELPFLFLNLLITQAATLTAAPIPHKLKIASINYFVLGLSSWTVMSVRQFRHRLILIGFQSRRSLQAGVPPLPSDLLLAVLIATIILVCLARLFNLNSDLGCLAVLTLLAATLLRIAAAFLDFRVRARLIDRALKHTRRPFASSTCRKRRLRLKKEKKCKVYPPFASAFWFVPVLITFSSLFIWICGKQNWNEVPGWILKNSDRRLHPYALLFALCLLGYAVPEFIHTLGLWVNCRFGTRLAFKSWIAHLPSHIRDTVLLRKPPRTPSIVPTL